jgi:hypothetical protein
MDVTELFTNIQKAWDGIEAQAAQFARGDKFECQLLNVSMNFLVVRDSEKATPNLLRFLIEEDFTV